MDVPNEEKLRIALEIIEHLTMNLFLTDIDVNQHLDTIISQYEDFKNIILRKFRATSVNKGEEINIKQLLKKDFRRIEMNYLSNFTNQLITEIQTNLIANLSIGKVENGYQYFIKN